MEIGCWLFGGEFEDSVFEEKPERRAGLPASYRAKRCERQKALQEYSSISEKLSSTNFAMKRDVQEGQARCLAHLGRHMEALEIATNLENKATNTDHLTTVLYLQFAICSSLQNLEKTIFCLQKLISLHPLNPWNWGRLAEAYLNLGPGLSASVVSSHKQDSFTSSDKTVKSSFLHSGRDCLLCFPETLPESSALSMEASSSNSQKNEKAPKNIQNCMAEKREAVLIETQMKACASFIRTRLLLQLTQSQQTSFALERNLRTQREIEDKMKGFSFKEDTLLLIAEGHFSSTDGLLSPSFMCLLINQQSPKRPLHHPSPAACRTTGAACHVPVGACFHLPAGTSEMPNNHVLVMGEDIIPEKIKDEVHPEVKCVGSTALTAPVTASSKEFEDKWFRKIKDHFCPFEKQFHAEIQIVA
ncbi:uncharacterized protein C8orf76 homolog isoform X2 [Cynocephalus volans]|uniref:uncharacterized protein C8orf76 homolog isoform X2 n=1 Tax=Cynocephalus volans TaxID=110931 RepID=UPI002FC699B1